MLNIFVKQLKNRYNDPSYFKRFVIGIDRSKMKLYDVEASAQVGLSDSGQQDTGPVFDKGDFGKRMKAEGSFEGWMRKIIVRESISYLRKKKQLEFSAEDMELYEKPILHDTTALDIEEVQLLIDKLPHGYRVVFIMFAIEGYKHSEISTLLKISESTSKSQLHKARKLLQQQIKQLNTTSYGIN